MFLVNQERVKHMVQLMGVNGVPSFPDMSLFDFE